MDCWVHNWGKENTESTSCGISFSTACLRSKHSIRAPRSPPLRFRRFPNFPEYYFFIRHRKEQIGKVSRLADADAELFTWREGSAKASAGGVPDTIEIKHSFLQRLKQYYFKSAYSQNHLPATNCTNTAAERRSIPRAGFSGAENERATPYAFSRIKFRYSRRSAIRRESTITRLLTTSFVIGKTKSVLLEPYFYCD